MQAKTITVAEHDDVLSFVCDSQILLQAKKDERGCLTVGFIDRTLLPTWPAVPAWYPCEAAIGDKLAELLG